MGAIVRGSELRASVPPVLRQPPCPHAAQGSQQVLTLHMRARAALRCARSRFVFLKRHSIRDITSWFASSIRALRPCVRSHRHVFVSSGRRALAYCAIASSCRRVVVSSCRACPRGLVPSCRRVVATLESSRRRAAVSSCLHVGRAVVPSRHRVVVSSCRRVVVSTCRRGFVSSCRRGFVVPGIHRGGKMASPALPACRLLKF